MRVTSVLEKSALFAAALAVNLGLYLLVPYIQILILKNSNSGPTRPKVVVIDIAITPPQTEKLEKREIKEIKSQAFAPPQPMPSRPSTPGGGLKIDLSPAGGEGQALLSGGDRTGQIGSGTGGGVGNGISAQTYEIGQTDTDAKPIGADFAPEYPARAQRDGISGIVDLTLVVNESGQVEQVSILKEDPTGYGFGTKAIETVKRLRFKPATFQKMSVRQRFKKRYTFAHE
jgi:periplasmic protein TonB